MRLFRALLLALTLPFVATPALAEAPGTRALTPAGPIALRDKVTVEGEIVRLGDLFRNVGSRARIPVAYAPAPGKQAILDAEWLTETARRHGVDWRPRSQFDRLVVRRASIPVRKAEIVQRIAQRLQAMGVRGDIRVALDQIATTVHLPVAAGKSFAIRELRYNKRNGRISAKLMAPADNPAYSLKLRGRLQRLVKLPVLARRIRRGEIIRASDIALKTVDRARVSAGTLIHRADVVGQAARRSLRRGEPVRGSDLRAPVLVRRGALVTMVIQTAMMRLTARGKALEAGGRGDTVRIRNIQSKRVVEGTVIGPDRVRIKLASPLAAR